MKTSSFTKDHAVNILRPESRQGAEGGKIAFKRWAIFFRGQDVLKYRKTMVIENFLGSETFLERAVPSWMRD